MLKTKAQGGQPTKWYGFLAAVEMEPGVDIEHVKHKLLEGVRFIEGVGKTEVEAMGVIDCYEEKE